MLSTHYLQTVFSAEDTSIAEVITIYKNLRVINTVENEKGGGLDLISFIVVSVCTAYYSCANVGSALLMMSTTFC